MTLGQKLKEIRKKFGLSQEQLAEIMNVSRQAITKWETDTGMPDTSNLQELSKVFGITIDYLLNNDNELPLLVMKKELDKEKYDNKISSYHEILKKFFPDPYEIYSLTRTKKMSKIERILDFLTIGIHEDIDTLSDLSPYYLIKKDYLKLLVNIKEWTLTVKELPTDIDDMKFTDGQNKFENCGKIILK